MRIVIIGGHLTPALSVIEELPKDAEVLFIGRRHALEGDKAVSLEYETINKLGIAFVDLKTGRFQRSLSRHTLPSFAKIPVGFTQAVKTLRKFKPDVVVGFGGYVSVPVVMAASFLRIPSVIHEQTLEVGAANKFLAKFATKICISFETSVKYFPKEKIEFTGNPIRKSIMSPKKKYPLPEGRPIIYITGGSLGSHFINQILFLCIPKLISKYTIVHQTGAAEEFNDFDKLLDLRKDIADEDRKHYVLSKHFSPSEVGSIMRQAAMVVSRAGINTVSELIYLKKPSLLIPLPKSQRNEQIKNATFLKELGLGDLADQDKLTAEDFLYRVNHIMLNLEEYTINSDKDHFPRNAALKIIDVIYAASKNRN